MIKAIKPIHQNYFCRQISRNLVRENITNTTKNKTENGSRVELIYDSRTIQICVERRSQRAES